MRRRATRCTRAGARGHRQALEAAGFARLDAHSAAADRQQYLRRPDLGRRLDPASRARLAAARAVPGPDVVFVIADGLSAVAAERHALPCCRPCGRCCRLALRAGGGGRAGTRGAGR